MFPLDFPLQLLGKAKKGQWVLDPFCGRGTTNFAARLRGLPSIGVDSNPVASAITSAKFAYATPAEIIELAELILSSPPSDIEIPTGEFWELAYHRQTLEELSIFRSALQTGEPSDAKILLRAFLLGRLHGSLTKGLPSYLSNQMPRTYASKPNYSVRFWRDRQLFPAYVSTIDLIKRKVAHYFEKLPAPMQGKSVLGDSRKINFLELGGPYSWVITSPPYYGMSTYLPDQWLRRWLLGGSPEVEYKSCAQLAHSSTEAFANQLGEIWTKVANACLPGAHLRVRFGGIPSKKAVPKNILLLSFQLSEAPWRITKTVCAGYANPGKRQAEQFLKKVKNPIEEFDLYATLES